MNFTPRFRNNHWHLFVLPAFAFRRYRTEPSRLCKQGRVGIELFAFWFRGEARLDIWKPILTEDEARGQKVVFI